MSRVLHEVSNLCAPIHCGLAVLALVVGLGSLPRPAGAADQGDVCVGDFLPGASCQANDVRIEEILIVSILESCGDGTAGEAEVLLQVLASAESAPDRYDIGIFLGLDAAGALTGDSCIHAHLAPPLTASPSYADANSDELSDLTDGPWWNGELADASDQCGDVEGNTQVFLTLESAVRVACTDANHDGTVELQGCVSWDTSGLGTCASLADAYPTTNSRCSCAVVELELPSSVIFHDGFEDGNASAWSLAVGF